MTIPQTRAHGPGGGNSEANSTYVCVNVLYVAHVVAGAAHDCVKFPVMLGEVPFSIFYRPHVLAKRLPGKVQEDLALTGNDAQWERRPLSVHISTQASLSSAGIQDLQRARGPCRVAFGGACADWVATTWKLL